MGLVAGVGFESGAYEALGSIPASRKWPDAEMAKWIAALHFRTRQPAEEFAATLRVERGLYLEVIEGMEKSPVVQNSISRFPPSHRRYFAQAKLALCEELEETVLSDGGEPRTSIDPAKWKRFGDHMAALAKMRGLRRTLGHAIFSMTQGIFDGLAWKENDRTAIQTKLENGLRLKSQ